LPENALSEDLFWNRWRKKSDGETGHPGITWKIAVKTSAVKLMHVRELVPIRTANVLKNF